MEVAALQEHSAVEAGEVPELGLKATQKGRPENLAFREAGSDGLPAPIEWVGQVFRAS